MDHVPLILGLVIGVVTSYTDMKTGFIDDLHVLPITGLGIVYYLYRGFFVEHNTMLAISGLIGFFIGLILGLVLYFLGAWASGDVVILAGFSALLPYPPSTASLIPPYALNYPLYPISILLNSIIAIFPFIFLYSLGVLIVRKKFAELREILTSGAKLTAEVALWITAALGLQIVLYETTGIALGGILGWLTTVVIIILLGKAGKIGNVLGFIVLGYLIYLDPEKALWVFVRLLAVIYLFKVFLSTVKFMRTEVLMEEVPVEKLEEWDVLGETIFEKDGRIGRDRTDPFTRMKIAIMTANLELLKPDYGRIIASPTAEGLKKEQIEELKRLVEEGKLENSFLRKKTMPFAPALFIGFLISYFWGDIFWWIQLKIAGL
ncbi:A24 family peptidase C-terminal domain-containing protein [Thermococcus sp. GR6]|uniref:A24 family peptidase C-terminal domain-containing protein n=1 Tax=Thermococcus sp. GR6 TaxID=1638256 RepID=UPI00142F83B0|nr:A24 family peptidase C-terminal domain-containing protein [Thermococcus sp. GR6]NJE41623.1 transposase [Thermococcus sp. GR6]